MKNIRVSLSTLCLLVTLTLSVVKSVSAVSEPIVGAIRWDGWAESWLNNQIQYFKPEKWHYRLPFFAYIEDDGVIRMPEGKQEIIDREINYATRAGINYWLFDWYEPGHNSRMAGFNTPLKLYLQSSNKNKLNFALMFMGNRLMGKAENWRTATVPLFLNYVKEPTYQTVLNNHPLVFFFQPETLSDLFGGTAKAKQELAYLRNRIQATTGTNPYFVGLISSASQVSLLDNLGLDSVSRYLTGANSQGTHGAVLFPYNQLLSWVNSFNQSIVTTGSPLVVTATIGVDDRPREEGDPDHDFNAVDVVEGSPNEITQMIKNAVVVTNQFPALTPSRSILLYAWNELSEGGWLTPGLTQGDWHLRAVALGLSHPYPPHVTTMVAQEGNTFILTLTGTLPQDAKIQLYDIGSTPWGQRLTIHRINDSKHTVILPGLNPPSFCNQNKDCPLTADIYNSVPTYHSFITFSLPKATPVTNPADLTDVNDKPGDQVNIFDYNILVGAFGKTGAAGWIKADIVKNGEVDIFDYNLLVASFGLY